MIRQTETLSATEHFTTNPVIIRLKLKEILILNLEKLGYFPGSKAEGGGREDDHSPPSSTKVKECVELYLHSPNISSWRGAQLSTETTGEVIFDYPAF
jgi:hypothetical protein